MTSNIEFYEKATIIRFFQNTLNRINQECFGEKLSVIDNGDYVTVKTQGLFVANYDIQKLWDALENYDQDDCVKFGNLWDYLNNCEYTLPEDQKSDNELKTDEELTFSEKRQVALVDWLLNEPVITKTSISNEELWEKNRELTKLVQQLKRENLELIQSIEEIHDFSRRELKERSEIINHLTARIHKLEQEVKQQSNQSDKSELEPIRIQEKDQSIIDFRDTVKAIKTGILPEPVIEQASKPEPKPEPKPTTKKRPKFKLPENFTEYQQECDDLIEGLSCLYNIKKGKWNGNILQFVLTPNDAQKENQLYPYPDKWKAGLYLQPGQWTIDKVNLADPDDWENWFLDINDFADANGIEIS